MIRHGTMTSTMSDQSAASTSPSTPGGGTPSATPGPLRRWWEQFRGWPRALRISAYVAIGVVLLLVATLVTGVVLVRRPFPQTSGTLEIAGLRDDVTVVRDDHGIPQLYGDTVDDLMRAQGFVHAQERFFEMDVRRHATAGRLAEMFGEHRARERRVRPHHGLAPGRRAGARADQAGDPGRPRRVRRRGQRLPRLALAQPDRGRVHRPQRRRPRLPPRALDGRWTRWPGSRRWRGTCAATWTTRSTGSSRSPSTPRRRSPSSTRPTTTARTSRSSGQGAVVDGVFEQDGDDRRDPQAAAPGVHRGGARRPRPPAARPGPAAAAAGQGRRHRQQQLGRRRRALRDRRAAARQRPAPRGLPARRLDADGAALHARCRRPARSTSPASRSPGCPASSSATTPTSPGGSPTSAPTSPTSTWRRSAATSGGTTAGGGRCAPAPRPSRWPARTTSG